MNCNEEIIIKIIGKLSLEIPMIKQLEIRDMLYEVFNNYEVTSRVTALVKTDIPERTMMYLAIKKLNGCSDKTLYNYRLTLQKFCEYVMKPVNFITTTDIRVYLATIQRESNLKSTSIGTTIYCLKSFFSWLVEEEFLAKNPTSKIKAPKVPIRLRKALDLEELERLRDASITLRQRALVEFLFATGCRVSEVNKANTLDINWENLSLRVIGKGNKERVVYFSPKAKLYIKKYLASRNDTNSALFIASKKPFGRLGSRSIEREITVIASLAKFDKAVFPHLLRHTMATQALRAGASLTTIQKILGHEDPGTTEIYAEIDDDTVHQEYTKHLTQ